MSPENVESFERATFIARLEKATDDAAFADAVYTAVSQYGLDEQKFRDAFGLSRGAVERWTQLQNLPQPIVRKQILAWIAINI